MAKIHPLATKEPVIQGVDLRMHCGQVAPKIRATYLIDCIPGEHTLEFCDKCAIHASKTFADAPKHEKYYVWAISSGQESRDMEGE